MKGFTLIELVMVIVILGILAAVATPKFSALIDEADRAAMKGIVGAFSSAAATNFATCKTGNVSDCYYNATAKVAGSAGTFQGCNEITSLLSGGSVGGESLEIGKKYIIASGTDGVTSGVFGTVASGTSRTCYIFKNKGGVVDMDFTADIGTRKNYIEFTVIVPQGV